MKEGRGIMNDGGNGKKDGKIKMRGQKLSRGESEGKMEGTMRRINERKLLDKRLELKLNAKI